MDIQLWSDNELRNYVMRESYVAWPRGKVDLSSLRLQFIDQARVRIAPVVQSRVLSRVGSLADPEGIAMVATDLVQNLCSNESAQRWLLVSTDPWDVLSEWTTREIVKSLRAMSVKARPSDDAIKQIEAANRS